MDANSRSCSTDALVGRLSLREGDRRYALARRRRDRTVGQPLDRVPPPRADREPARLAPVRAQPRRLCAHAVRRGDGAARRAHGRGHRHVRAPGDRPRPAPFGRVAHHHQRHRAGSPDDARVRGFPPRLSGNRARRRGVEPGAESVEARCRRRGARDRSPARDADRTARGGHRVGGVCATQIARPRRSMRAPMPRNATGSASATTSPT